MKWKEEIDNKHDEILRLAFVKQLNTQAHTQEKEKERERENENESIGFVLFWLYIFFERIVTETT